MRKQIINQFVLEYVDQERKEMEKQYPDFSHFKNEFEVSDKLLSRLIKYAENNGISEDKAALVISKEQIEILLKAYIARDLYSTNEFYEISNVKDPKFETAVTILRNWDKYEAMLLNKK
jgi:carboxyl-terminal processing protease